jgi:hypothetical protein
MAATEFYISASLLILTTILCPTLSLKCHECQSRTNRTQSCTTQCTGDMCALWADEHGNTIQSCLAGKTVWESVFYVSFVGIPQVAIGCRRNGKNATLCTCNNSENCNKQEMLNDVRHQIVNMPTVSCYEYVDAPFYSTIPGNCQKRRM